jgi:hypothetical protein
MSKVVISHGYSLFDPTSTTPPSRNGSGFPSPETSIMDLFVLQKAYKKE